jgi:UTP--glucose-1-phosphate uridylyltransferase
VIPAAGLGTRLLPATKEQPKEMLPVFAPSENGNCIVKPLLQLVFEQLYDVGMREFCFVIGRGKRAIEDHFTQDVDYLEHLTAWGKNQFIYDLQSFYRRLDDSTIVWINQPKPLGFGDAVLRTRKTIGDEDFLVHAGDTYIVSQDNDHIRSLLELFQTRIPEAVFAVKKMQDVTQRGVIEGRDLSLGLYLVDRVVEKPRFTSSNLAIEPVYVFRNSIFDALESVKAKATGEIQLTDAIQEIINSGKEVIARQLLEENLRLDVGDPDSYWEALSLSHKRATEIVKMNLQKDLQLVKQSAISASTQSFRQSKNAN